MARIAIASVMQESNNFSPVYTRYDDFTPVFGSDAYQRHRGALTEMGGFIDVLERSRHEIAPVCAAWAITANRMRRPDLELLAVRFEKHLKSVRADAFLFAMHGAQTAEGEDDVEGYLLTRARTLLGPAIPIVVTLDLHANVTRRMVELSDAIVGYHTYPHVDMFETGVKAARLMLRMLKNRWRPVKAFRKLPLIVPPENCSTSRGMMHRLMQQAEGLEKSGRASAVSIFPVQPWLDIEEMGCSIVVVGNGDARAAERDATGLARRFWDNRRAFDVQLTPVEEAVAAALRTRGGPVVLAESSDSTGSGSPGDSTGVLKVLLKAPMNGPAAIFLVDPAGVARAAEAGPGSTVTMKIGGAFDKAHSKPVKVKAYVKQISDGRWIPRAKGYNTGIPTSMGRSVVLEVGHVHILMAERSAMTVDPELFRSQGIEPAHCRIVVVKSPLGFRSAYEPIAKAIYVVDTPGVSSSDLKQFRFRRVPRPIDPLDADTPRPEGL